MEQRKRTTNIRKWGKLLLACLVKHRTDSGAL